jgi:hypothetical protein
MCSITASKSSALRPGPWIVLVAASFGLVWSWRTWPDPTIDFGRELYVPWRLSQGDVLFRDIVSFNGPLSHYLLAGWFAITDASLLSLVVLNVAVLGATLALAYALLARIASEGAAILSCLTFLAVFAYAQVAPKGMLPLGNYNWISPYSHELTHGIALALLALYLLFRFARDPRPIWAAGSGLAMGCVLLTKAEVSAAALVASATGLAATLWLARAPLKRSIGVLGGFSACALVPAIVSTLLLSAAMPFPDALSGTLGTWPYVLDAPHRDLPYFRWGMGTNDLLMSGFRILRVLFAYAALLILAGALALLRPGDKLARVMPLAAFAALAALVATAWLAFGWLAWFDGRQLLQWNNLAQPWQLLLLAVGIVFARPVLRREVEPAQRAVAALRLALVAFSLLLLGKMMLNVRVFHYGFALAAPAAWIMVALFWTWLPDWFQRRGGNRAVLRSAFLGIWLVTVTAHLAHIQENLSTRNHWVGSGADAFRAPPRGAILSAALAYLEQHAGPSDTLAALPEGIMVNYLMRKATSTPFIQYTPPLITLYGEQRMIEALASSPPDWIVLVHRSDAEYGTPFFGRDYAQELRKWIAENYAQQAQMGAMPFRGRQFGILILKRRE